jgi:hypothetical protein
VASYLRVASRVENHWGHAHEEPWYRHPLRLLTLCLPGCSPRDHCGAMRIPSLGSGYRVSYGTASGVHPTTLDVGNQTTAAFTGLTPGQRYYFVVRAYTATQVSPASVEVSGVALGLVAVTSTAGSSTIPTGAPVTWTALASGGVALEYQFSQHQPSGTNDRQNYSSANTFSGPAAGRHVIRAWARVPDRLKRSTPSGRQSVHRGYVAAKLGSIEADVALPARWAGRLPSRQRRRRAGAASVSFLPAQSPDEHVDVGPRLQPVDIYHGHHRRG